MSKALFPPEGKPNPSLEKVSGSPDDHPIHLATTARGVALARAALSEAHSRARTAEEAHRLNLERALAEERAIIKALRLEMYGPAIEAAISQTEDYESQVWAAAEEVLWDNPEPEGTPL